MVMPCKNTALSLLSPTLNPMPSLAPTMPTCLQEEVTNISVPASFPTPERSCVTYTGGKGWFETPLYRAESLSSSSQANQDRFEDGMHLNNSWSPRVSSGPKTMKSKPNRSLWPWCVFTYLLQQGALLSVSSQTPDPVRVNRSPGRRMSGRGYAQFLSLRGWGINAFHETSQSSLIRLPQAIGWVLICWKRSTQNETGDCESLFHFV